VRCILPTSAQGEPTSLRTDRDQETVTDRGPSGAAIHLAARAPSDLQEGLAEVTDQIDKVIGELRGFAFTHRG
jgi:hypothetical protein